MIVDVNFKNSNTRNSTFYVCMYVCMWNYLAFVKQSIDYNYIILNLLILHFII